MNARGLIGWWVCVCCLAMSAVAVAAPVTFTWDVNPHEAEQDILDYVLYELDLVDPARPPIDRAHVPSTALGGQNKVTVQVEPGVHAFVLTARNTWNESAPSNTATTPPANLQPDAPKGLRIVLLMLQDGTAKLEVSGAPWTLTRVEASPDLHTWHMIFSKVNVRGDFVCFDRGAVGATQRFYRAIAQQLIGANG
jgi:hypothetical protein